MDRWQREAKLNSCLTHYSQSKAIFGGLEVLWQKCRVEAVNREISIEGGSWLDGDGRPVYYHGCDCPASVAALYVTFIEWGQGGAHQPNLRPTLVTRECHWPTPTPTPPTPNPPVPTPLLRNCQCQFYVAKKPFRIIKYSQQNF